MREGTSLYRHLSFSVFLAHTIYLFVLLIKVLYLFLLILIFFFMFIMHVIPVSIYADGVGINEFN